MFGTSKSAWLGSGNPAFGGNAASKGTGMAVSRGISGASLTQSGWQKFLPPHGIVAGIFAIPK